MVTFGSTRPAFGKVVDELVLVGSVPTTSRALIVAALIGYDLSR